MNKRFDPTKDHVQHPKKGSVPVKYFLPGQIILQVRHPVSFTPEMLVSEITEFISQGSEQSKKASKYEDSEGKGDQPWKQEIQPPLPASIITFPPGNEGDATTFSIVPIPLVKKNMPDKELFVLVKEINTQLLGGGTSTSGGVVFEAASPNWLTGGSPGQSGTGGPGSWPIPAELPTSDCWKFRFHDKSGAIPEPPLVRGDGDDIHVAILDTMPTEHDMKAAYQKWRWFHPLIESLLREDGPLHIYPASYADLHEVEDYDLRGHRYLMRDHGLFIASIIHNIAPKATLHLYEVLNPYGVGSIETIARGLLSILNNPKIPRGCPLIINCSFMLAMPTEEVFDPDFELVIENKQAQEKLTLTTRIIFDLLASRQNTILVAAAGNDGYGNTRPATRYPAAFDGILGVGAMPKQPHQTSGPYTAATYSNVSDDPPYSPDPPRVSYITLGGESGPKQGVLGIYIGEFPEYKESTGCLGFLLYMLGLGKKKEKGFFPGDPSVRAEFIKYRRNTTGWAWWAGTSFATPIISGILAAQHSQAGMSGQDLKSNVDRHLGGLLQPSDTSIGEKVILVEQGC